MLPHLEQNFPEVGSPQLGHAVGEAVMGSTSLGSSKGWLGYQISKFGKKENPDTATHNCGNYEDFVKTVTSMTGILLTLLRNSTDG